MFSHIYKYDFSNYEIIWCDCGLYGEHPLWLHEEEDAYKTKHGVYDIIAFSLVTMDWSCVDPSVTQRSELIQLMSLICSSKLFG